MVTANLMQVAWWHTMNYDILVLAKSVIYADDFVCIKARQ